MEKFYKNNKDLLLRYFQDLEQYEALIRANNWRKMHEIFMENFNGKHFELPAWVIELKTFKKNKKSC